MTIAQTLSWEIQALNDRGDYRPEQLLALEIVYGLSLEIVDPDTFGKYINTIIGQVSDQEMQRLLLLYANRGLKDVRRV